MSQQIIIDYWVEKAEEDLATARDNHLNHAGTRMQ